MSKRISVSKSAFHCRQTTPENPKLKKPVACNKQQEHNGAKKILQPSIPETSVDSPPWKGRDSVQLNIITDQGEAPSAILMVNWGHQRTLSLQGSLFHLLQNI